MKHTIVVFAMLAAAACERTESRGSGTNVAAANAPADNTKRNEADRNTSALTPGDQAENQTDRTITQQIRQDVVTDDSLSLTGKNVKIITVGGVVTLRGPVRNSKEKSDIAAIAQRVYGVNRVVNQLEVATN